MSICEWLVYECKHQQQQQIEDVYAYKRESVYYVIGYWPPPLCDRIKLICVPQMKMFFYIYFSIVNTNKLKLIAVLITSMKFAARINTYSGMCLFSTRMYCRDSVHCGDFKVRPYYAKSCWKVGNTISRIHNLRYRENIEQDLIVNGQRSRFRK